MNISNIINRKVYTITDKDSIEKALNIMNEMSVNGMPVVNEESKLVGMVVKADIYRFMVQPGHYESCPVEWVMSKSVIVAYADEDILIVSKRLRSNNISAVPVLDGEKVVGILSIEDLLDYFIK